MSNKFGTLLEQKRKEANLTISELALVTGLSEGQLEVLETGAGNLPDFDTCYRLGQAISSHTRQPFLLSAFSEARRFDAYERKLAGRNFAVS
jgi:transcriptional regulator with XRE-family HTH domain